MPDDFTSLVLPYQVVRARLVQTAEHVGCASNEAMALAQGAWHLCNRGLAGVSYLLRYLKCLSESPGLPRNAIVPTAVSLLKDLERRPTRCRSFIAPPAPLLLLPPLGFELERSFGAEAAILFSYNGHDLVYSKPNGLRIETPQRPPQPEVNAADLPTCTITRVGFADGADRGVTFGFQRLQTLSLPRHVYRDKGPLALDNLQSSIALAAPQRVDSGGSTRHTVT